MRVVIVGGGEVGFALAQGLSTSHEVVVIDHAPDVGTRFEPLDVQFLLGSGTRPDLLERAGIERADVLVACTGLDEVNLVAATGSILMMALALASIVSGQANRAHHLEPDSIMLLIAYVGCVGAIVATG